MGTRLKQPKRTIYIWVVLGLLILIVLVTAGIIYQTRKNGVVAAQQNTLFALQKGEIANDQSLSIKINSIQYSEKVDHAFPLSKDQHAVIVDLEIQNKTAKNQIIVPSTMFYIRTFSGQYYPFILSSYANNYFEYGEVKPGETVKGQVSFNLQKGILDPLLYIDLGWNGHVPVVYDILH